MSLLVGGISIVTKKSTIEDKYRGGLEQYVEDCPNSTFCADEHLTAIMFQTLDDGFRWIRRLEIHGLVFIRKCEFVDIAMVKKLGGLYHRCDWLRFSRVRAHLLGFEVDGDDKISVCRLAGTRLGELAMPEGWNLNNSLNAYEEYIPIEERYSKLQFVEYKDGIEVFLYNVLDEKIYSGRPFGGGNEVLMSHDFREKGLELLNSYLSIASYSCFLRDSDIEEERGNLRIGIQYLKESARLHPYDWVTFWYLGKAYQAIEEYSQAYRHFKSAYNLYNEDPDVFKGLMQTCWELEKDKEALSVASAAVKSWPDEAEWISDLGQALLLDGQVQNAENLLIKASRMDPEDDLTKTRIELLSEVKSYESELLRKEISD